jgi:hypothetical protein
MAGERLRRFSGQHIEWTQDGTRTFFQNVSVNHGSADIGMSEQFLHGADIRTRFQKVRGETVPQRVTTYFFGPAQAADSGSNRPLHASFMEVMTPLDTGLAWIFRQLPGSENELPT